MTFLIWSGAVAGGIAVRPSADSCAVGKGVVRGAGGRSPPVSGGGSDTTPAPPELRLVAASARVATRNDPKRAMSAIARAYALRPSAGARKPTLLRQPTGLADGLALKEPAPPPKRTRPKQPGSPAPHAARGD